MEQNTKFWDFLNGLVKENEIIIDRPKGSRHPRHNDVVYEFDYGYIKNTKTTDGGGIDVFKGSLHNKNVNTIICTIDLYKKDIEIKILIGCTVSEKKKIYDFLNGFETMQGIMIEKDVPIDNVTKEIAPIKANQNFEEIFEVFEDVVGNPSKENVSNILLDYEQNNEKTLYGYFLAKKLAGIIGIKRNAENIEIMHFGIHPEYRGKRLGTELMDYIKKENKRMVLTTDDDAILFYKKYGYKYTEYYEEKYQRKRYNCEYTQ
ncbi:MAG: GNAT family N-acetyltransferase [Treponema sp.]|jgi:inorganic pyrophosphatase|nr:GNAT family N-acetyltransferase [Treponema sp.]